MGGLDVNLVADIVAWFLIGFGFISIFFPFAPSIPMIWFGIFINIMSHGLSSGQRFFSYVSAIALATIFLDFTLNKFGVYKIKAGAWGVIGAIVGFIVGSFFGTWAAYFIGPVLGAVVFELMSGHDQVFSFDSGNTTVVAFMGGTIVKFVAAIAMIGLFILRLQGKI